MPFLATPTSTVDLACRVLADLDLNAYDREDHPGSGPLDSQSSLTQPDRCKLGLHC